MAATKTQLIGGAFQDGEGNPLDLGYLKMKLNQDASVSGVGNICSGIEITIQLDANGNVVTSPAQSVWANTGGVLSPINTYYRVTGYTAAGQRAWGPNNQQVGSGATFNLGSWVPNSVISWFPTILQPQPLTLEVNGTPNEDQGLLNLTAGTNVTIIDQGAGEVLISASGGGSFGTAGAVGFWGPGMLTLFGTTNNGGSVSTTSNQVTVFQFILESEWVISTVSFYSENASNGNSFSFGIYDYDGNKLLDSGAMSIAGPTGVKTATITPVILSPGIYYFAQSATSGTTTRVTVLPDTVEQEAVMNQGSRSVVIGQAANATFAGIMPATLGAISADTLQLGSALVYFAP